MTTASKHTDPSRRSNPSRTELEEMAPTLLRLPDLHPPTDAGEGCAEEDLSSVEHDDSASPVMQELLDVATRTTADAANQPSVTRLPDLAPVAAPEPARVPPKVAIDEPVVSPEPVVSSKSTESFSAAQSSPSLRAPSLEAIRESVSAEVERDEPKSGSSETLGHRALALVGSRNALLVLLALIACWAVFAPRRHPNAHQNSEALSAKDPAIEETASKSGAKPASDSVAVSKEHRRPKSSPSKSDSASSSDVAKATAKKPARSGSSIAGSLDVEPRGTGGTHHVADAKVGMSMPPHSMNKTKLGQPAHAGGNGQVPGGTSLVQSQLASSPMQHGVGGVPPFDSVPFHSEPPAKSASPMVREPAGAKTHLDANLTASDSSVNSELSLPPNDEVLREEQNVPANSELPSVPVPLQTGTPGPITNWIDYLPPLPSELGEQASVDVGQTASPDEFPTTQSPRSPDFQFALPGDGPEVSVGSQVPSSGEQPEARVAAPSFFPESNLRR